MITRLVAASLMSSLLAAGAAAGLPPSVRIGIAVDGPWAGNDPIVQLTRQEIWALTRGEFEVHFPAEHYLVGDWTLEGAKALLDRLLQDPEVDLVIAWGLLASHALCCYGELPKPVIAPVIIDVELQGLPYDEGASGIPNLNYVSLPDNLANELAVFRRLVPFKKLAFLSNRAFVEAIPQLHLRTRSIVQELGVDFELVPVGFSAQDALEKISADTQAAYVWPLFHLPPVDFQELIDGLNERHVPTFSAIGPDEVRAGILATLNRDDFLARLTRRVALNVQRILLGEDAGAIPVDFIERDKLTINMDTARAIGVSPPWDLLIEAEVIESPETAKRSLSLAAAVDEAVAANLDLAVQRQVVAAGKQEVALGRSALLPRLDASALALRIDEDRAEASFGSQSERSVAVAATLSQLLYSDPALANVKIQKERQSGRRLELETLRLDIVLEAAVTYLNLLRAKSLVQIQRNNLELTRSNLELAQTRRLVGAGNPAEVFRWESQIASDRKALIEAVADQRVAEIALNRLLHRDLDTELRIQEVGVDDPGLMTGREEFERFTKTPRRLRLFTDFMVREGLAVAPELDQLRAAIAAQERLLKTTARAFWVPTVALQGNLEELLSKGGAGSESSFGIGPAVFPAPDDSQWSLGLSASLPLFTGGARRAVRIQANEELLRLRLLYQSTQEKISQRIHTAMTNTSASYPGVELARRAAESAHKNLELLADAYARGAVPIIDLLDAQNAALNADQLAADAIYDFLIDLMEVERATNRFDFFLSPAAQEAWFQGLERYYREQGVVLPRE